MRYWTRLSAMVVVAMAAHCADLEEIDSGLCGNQVLEPGEDCDTFAGIGGNCGDKDGDKACHFYCSRNEDDNLFCPTGWGCGTDGICRRPTGTFSELATYGGVGEARPMVGDFDGNELPDLLTSSGDRISVYYAKAGEAPQHGFDLPPVPGVPAIGDLSEDGRQDLVLLDDWMMVMRGAADQSFEPTIYAPFLENDPELIAVLMDAMPEHFDDVTGSYENLGDELLMFRGGSLMHGDANDQSVEGVSEAAGGDIGAFAARAQVGNVITWGATAGVGCEELLFPLVGSQDVEMYAPCTTSADDALVWNLDTDIEVDSPVKVPDGMSIGDRGLMLAKLNDDIHLDLLIHCEGRPESDEAYNSGCPTNSVPPLTGGAGGMSSGGAGQTGGAGGSGSDYGGGIPGTAGGPPGEPTWSGVCVAYGYGDGTFEAHPPIETGPNAAGANEAAPVNNPALVDFPLAAGDLNDDGVVDFVTRNLLQISTDVSSNGALLDCVRYRPVFYAHANWDYAHIADFNGNGIVDVLVASRSNSALTFLNGAGGGVFNEFTVPLDGPADLLAVGDFDGDLLLDVAFRIADQRDAQTEEDGGPQESEGDVLAVSFGTPFGAPSPPVSMGRLADMAQITAGNLSSLHYDGIDDLVVVTRSLDGSSSSVATLMGSSERVLEAPFFFRREVEEFDDELQEFFTRQAYDLPLVSSVGRFTAVPGPPTHPDVAVLTWQIPEEFLRAQAEGQPSDLVDPVPEWHLWLLPSTGAAAVDRSLAVASRLNDVLPDPWGDDGTEHRLDGARSVMTPLDLDGDEVDELVLLGTYFSATIGSGPWELSAQGMLAVWRSDGTRWFLEPPGVQFLEESYRHDVDAATAQARSGSDGAGGGDPGDGVDFFDPDVDFDGRVLVADLSNDQHPDVLALSAVLQLEESVDFFDGSIFRVTGVAREIVLFQNEGTGTLDADQRVRFEMEPAGAFDEEQKMALQDRMRGELMDFALLNVDGDPEMEMALLTPSVVLFADIVLGEDNKLIVRDDLKLEGPFEPGLRLAAGDFDGDGLHDIVVVDTEKAVLFRAQPWVRQ